MKARFAAVVLYEDQCGPTGQFGLHKFVVACVADQVQRRTWTVETVIDGRPRNGIDKLLATCKESGEELCDRSHVFVLVDEDRIRRRLGLPASTPMDAVIEALQAQWFRHPRLTYHLLSRNLESVLGALAKCDSSIDAAQLERAMAKKPVARDLLFANAARTGRAVRDCVRREVPTLAALISALAEVVRRKLKR